MTDSYLSVEAVSFYQCAFVGVAFHIDVLLMASLLLPA